MSQKENCAQKCLKHRRFSKCFRCANIKIKLTVKITNKQKRREKGRQRIGGDEREELQTGRGDWKVNGQEGLKLISC